MALFRNAPTAGAQAIAITPSDRVSMNNLINETVARGIPVGTVVLDAPDSKRIFFTGPDVYKEGFEQGKRVVEKLHKNGTKGSGEGCDHVLHPGRGWIGTAAQGQLDVVIKRAGLIFANPNADQSTRDVVSLRQSMQTLPGELLRKLPLEGGTVGTMLAHGLHPLKAQHRWSIQIFRAVHPQGRTP
jgi:ABC-type sugar transport system substrate-binding protein